MNQSDVAEMYTDLRRFARSLCRSSQDAEDVSQEAALRLLERGRMPEEVRNPKAYALRTVRNIFLDQARRKKAARRLMVPLEESPCHGEQDEAFSARIAIADAATVLSKLSVKQRKIFECVVLNGMSYAETASALGLPIGTVMSSLSRARRLLRA